MGLLSGLISRMARGLLRLLHYIPHNITWGITLVEATLGELYPLAPLVEAGGTVVDRYNYGKIIYIFMGAIYAYTVSLIVVGPEWRGENTNVELDADMDEMILEYGGYEH
ncbi:hypothetical protein N7486_009830 [Penicillium sp. IBT 16267x]|nr:hypothetical protein N7486_009830 [Penicillium sp. IBT 16267x]